jgi:hypothetical protein
MTLAALPFRSVQRGSGYLRIGAGLSTFVVAVAIVLTATGTEPALTAMSLGVLIFGAKLLWRPGEPPILFGAFFIQWLQVSLAIFRSSFNGIQLDSLYGGGYGTSVLYGGYGTSVGYGLVAATWLSLLGLLVLASGIRLALRGVRPAASTKLVSEVRQLNPEKAFMLYCFAEVACLGLEAVTWWAPGLAQALIALTNFRWLFFFILAVIIFIQRRRFWLLAFVTIFEVVRGFLSYYSDYKDVFLVLIIAFLTARPKLNIRSLAVISLIGATVIVLSAAWQEVKSDYRRFLSAGTGQQLVLVGPLEQLDRISELMLDKGIPHLAEGLNDLVQRIEYTYYFGRVVEHVPSVLPHDDGAIWAAAVTHVLTPRLLFPNKGSSWDVDNTQHYAGLKLTQQGGRSTEIPMGYMAESYIDFGSLGMFVPVFLLGLLYGGQYRYILTRPQWQILAFGAAPVLMMPVSKFETTAIKILGGSLTTFGVFLIAFGLFAPNFYRMLRATKRTPPAPFLPTATISDRNSKV